MWSAAEWRLYTVGAGAGCNRCLPHKESKHRAADTHKWADLSPENNPKSCHDTQQVHVRLCQTWPRRPLLALLFSFLHAIFSGSPRSLTQHLQADLGEWFLDMYLASERRLPSRYMIDTHPPPCQTICSLPPIFTAIQWWIVVEECLRRASDPPPPSLFLECLESFIIQRPNPF